MCDQKVKDAMKLVLDSQRIARKGVADMTLMALRNIRNNSPVEYDALMKTESGPVICSLWDYLREVSDD